MLFIAKPGAKELNRRFFVCLFSNQARRCFIAPALMRFKERRDIIVTYQKRSTVCYRNEVLGIGKPGKLYRHSFFLFFFFLFFSFLFFFN